MATLDSNKVDKALRSKMQAERESSADWFYLIKNEEGLAIASTSISKGAKETLRDNRVSQMAKQLRFDNARQFVEFVSCAISRADALEIMQRNYLRDPERRRK